MINVEKQGDDLFEVTVTEGSSATRHSVRVDDGYHQQLTGGQMGKEELVRRSFEFLLAREPKESILSEFDLRVISRYFPSYEDEISP